ncbi:MAG: hypothetical protein KA116_03435 [Proteobacteria bacterium]|nr:hypothetical protein [Pseudomonadota bacterium]
MKKLALLVLSILIFNNFVLADEAIKKSVTIDISSANQLDASDRALVESLKAALEAKLFAWEKFSVSAPSSVFENSEFVSLSDLIIQPDNSEVLSLGGGKLSADQVAQLKEEGMFVVPSVKYPGQNHVWKMSAWFQHGTKTLNVKFTNLQTKAATQLLVKIPQSVIGGDVSDGATLRKGIRRIGMGLSGLFDALLGKIHKKNTFNEYEVAELLRNAFVKLNPSANILDIPTNIELYAPIVERIAAQVSQEWEEKVQEEKKAELVAQAEKLGYYLNDSALANAYIKEGLESELIKLFDIRLSESQDLAKISTELAPALVSRLKANKIIERYEANIQSELEIVRSQIQAIVAKERPYLSKIQSWFDKEVERRYAEIYSKRRFSQYDELVSTLRLSGYTNESTRVANLLKFLSEKADEHDSQLRNALSPARTFEVSRQIWRSKNWGIIEDLARDGRTHYSLDDERVSKVTTDVPGWRLWLIAARTRKYMADGVYALAYLNIVNGPMGLRSLFGKDPFYATKTIDPDTGKIIDQKSSLTQTMASRWAAIDAQVKRDIERAMEKKSSSLLSEGAYKKLTNLRYKYIKQLFLKGGLLLGQPVLTTCNVVVSAGLCVTAPAWSPVLATLQWAFNLVLYDRDNASQSRSRYSAPLISPLAQGLIANVGIFGVGQSVLSVFRIMWHALASAGIETWAAAQWAGLKAKDVVIRGALLNSSFLKVPTDDTWLARRISGPGLESNYYYQIKPDLALIVLQLQLEQTELRLFYNESTYKALEPHRVAEKELAAIFGSFADVGPLNSRGFHEEILKSVVDAEKAVGDAVNNSQEFLNKVSGVSQVNLSKVRLSAEALDELILKSVAVVEKFYNQNLLPKFAGDEARVTAYWNQNSLTQGDFLGLAKILLVEAFAGQGILTPLKDIAGNFSIVVNDEPSVGDVAAKVLDGATIPSLDTLTPVVVDTTKSKDVARLNGAPSVQLNLAQLSTATCELRLLPKIEARN